MSVILDALDRARRERGQRKSRDGASTSSDRLDAGEAPAPLPPATPTKHPTPLWVYILAMTGAAGFGAAMAFLAYLMLERQQGGRHQQTAESTPATAVTTQTAVVATPPTSMIMPPGYVMGPYGWPIPPQAPPANVSDLPIAATPIPTSNGFPTDSGRGRETAPAAPADQLPTLGSIACDARGCTAIINGRMSKQGQRVGRYEVTLIEEDKVTLRDTATGVDTVLEMRH